MLSALPYPGPQRHNFTPLISSPLSPRSANIHGRRRNASMSEPQPANNRNAKENVVPYAQRAVKSPHVPRQKELTTRRRDLFLRNVRDGREEKRWEARGEDMMRLDFVQRRREWEAEQARSAPSDLSPGEEEEDEEKEDDALPSSMHVASQLQEEEVDEVLRREDEELEALLSFMPVDGEEQVEIREEAEKDLRYWYSDDDDYDKLFEEFMEGEGGKRTVEGSGPRPEVETGEAMDMS